MSVGLRISILVFLLLGCKPAPMDSASQAVASGTQLQLRLAANGKLQIAASDGSVVQSVSRLVTTGSSPDARTIAIRFESASVQIGGSACTSQLNGKLAGVLTCDTGQQVTNSATTAVPSATPSLSVDEQPVVDEGDFTQRVRIREGMHCGLHYGEKKWQVRFDVYIDGTAEALDAVQSVSYDVFSAYNGGQPRVVGDRASRFDTNVGYLTPVSGWSTGPATVTLKNGDTLTLGAASIVWTNPDPANTPTGQPCD
jgi:hypothetical protein